jgi:hypothetical protein
MAATAKNLPALVAYDDIQGAKYRASDCHGRYRFAIGKTVAGRQDHRVLLAVPVGPHSLARGIEVFGRDSIEDMRLDDQEHCFSISISRTDDKAPAAHKE